MNPYSNEYENRHERPAPSWGHEDGGSDHGAQVGTARTAGVCRPPAGRKRRATGLRRMARGMTGHWTANVYIKLWLVGWGRFECVSARVPAGAVAGPQNFCAKTPHQREEPGSGKWKLSTISIFQLPNTLQSDEHFKRLCG